MAIPCSRRFCEPQQIQQLPYVWGCLLGAKSQGLQLYKLGLGFADLPFELFHLKRADVTRKWFQMISGISKHLIFAKGCNHLRSGQDAAIKCGQKHFLNNQHTFQKNLFEKTRDGSRSDQPFRGLQPSSARKASSNHGLKVQISCYYILWMAKVRLSQSRTNFPALWFQEFCKVTSVASVFERVFGTFVAPRMKHWHAVST